MIIPSPSRQGDAADHRQVLRYSPAAPAGPLVFPAYVPSAHRIVGEAIAAMIVFTLFGILAWSTGQ